MDADHGQFTASHHQCSDPIDAMSMAGRSLFYARLRGRVDHFLIGAGLALVSLCALNVAGLIGPQPRAAAFGGPRAAQDLPNSLERRGVGRDAEPIPALLIATGRARSVTPARPRAAAGASAWLTAATGEFDSAAIAALACATALYAALILPGRSAARPRPSTNASAARAASARAAGVTPPPRAPIAPARGGRRPFPTQQTYNCGIVDVMIPPARTQKP